MRLFILLSLLVPLHAKTVELRFPGLAYAIQLSLPENFDPSRKHPAILYYHGTNGRPDTRIIRRETGDKDWIVVGMTYFQQGQLKLAPESFKKEVTLYHSVRQYLLAKYALDPKRLYISGFSKGGWMSDLLLQQEATLAGGAILGAGHRHKAARPQKRYTIEKPIFIGVGRLDGNYPFALKGLLHHRSLGGNSVMETWPGLAHEFPQDGSTGLRQWFAVRNKASKTVAKIELATALESANELDPLARWDQLRQLRDLPFTKFLGTPFSSELSLQIKALEKDDPVKTEAALLQKHRRILAKEIKGTSLRSLQEANLAYIDLSDQNKTTRQAKLLLHDYNRTSDLLLHFQEQKKVAPNKNAPIKVPDSPKTDRGIPGNPLIR
jgi:predicted esterase